MTTTILDCGYGGQPGVVASYLLEDGDEVAFVETATSVTLPRLLAALEARGRRPEDVRYVIVTHIHLDHAGGAGALMARCPHAVLIAHPRAAPHAVDPGRIVAGATAVYGAERFAALYGDVVPVPAGRVRAMDDGASLPFGRRTLTFLHTRGHANHHFVVHDDADDAVFTGDAFGILYPALQRNGPFAFPSTTPTDFDPEAARAAIDRIVGTGASTVLPTHFGRHGALPVLAEQLHRGLDAHAAILAEVEADGLEGDALDARCAGQVAAWFGAALAAHGLASDAHACALAALDAALNAQGLAAAVRRRRRTGR